jgi:hypothetical protein
LYYQKLRNIEQDIADEDVVVVSHETPDGGKAGQKTEVSRAVAAMMIVEGRAHLATKEEATHYYKSIAESRRIAEQAALSGRVQLNLISESDVRALKGALRQEKQ